MKGGMEKLEGAPTTTTDDKETHSENAKHAKPEEMSMSGGRKHRRSHRRSHHKKHSHKRR